MTHSVIGRLKKFLPIFGILRVIFLPNTPKFHMQLHCTLIHLIYRYFYSLNKKPEKSSKLSIHFHYSIPLIETVGMLKLKLWLHITIDLSV